MADRRSERPRRALGVDVDPPRVVGRRGEQVESLLRHLDPRGSGRARHRRTREGRSRGCLHSGPDPGERRLLAEQFEALVQAGRHTRARDRDPDREVDRPGLLAEVVAELLERRLDLPRSPVLDALERVGRSGENPRVEKRRDPDPRRGRGTRRTRGTRRGDRSFPARAAPRQVRGRRASRVPARPGRRRAARRSQSTARSRR